MSSSRTSRSVTRAKTNRRTRDATEKTQKIQKTERETQRAQRGLKECSEIREYLSYVRRITINYDKYRREAMRLHARRRVRELSLDRRVGVTVLVQITGQEAAYRGRLTEMRIECERLTARIEKMRDATIQSLLLSGRDIPGSSKTERREYLVTRLDRETPVLDDLYDVIEACKYIVEDIDQQRVNVNRLTQLYELSTRPDLTH